MIKIRIWGLPEQVEQAKMAIEESFKINYVSQAFSDRGESKYVRRYIEAETYGEKIQVKQAGGEHGV